MDFIGKICPYCKTEFKEGDDVVVCSICEMPHHKECWIENKACTTFGCTGTIVGAEQYAEAVDNKTFCSKECRYQFEKYPTYEEITSKYEELKSWNKVAEFYGITRKIIQGIRKRHNKQD